MPSSNKAFLNTHLTASAIIKGLHKKTQNHSGLSIQKEAMYLLARSLKQNTIQRVNHAYAHILRGVNPQTKEGIFFLFLLYALNFNLKDKKNHQRQYDLNTLKSSLLNQFKGNAQAPQKTIQNVRAFLTEANLKDTEARLDILNELITSKKEIVSTYRKLEALQKITLAEVETLAGTFPLSFGEEIGQQKAIMLLALLNNILKKPTELIPPYTNRAAARLLQNQVIVLDSQWADQTVEDIEQDMQDFTVLACQQIWEIQRKHWTHLGSTPSVEDIPILLEAYAEDIHRNIEQKYFN